MNRRLALVLLPLAAGLTGATAYAAAGSGTATTTAALTPAAVPAPGMPAGVTATAASGAKIGVTSAVAAATVTVLTVGGIAAGITLTPAPEVPSAVAQSSPASADEAPPNISQGAPAAAPPLPSAPASPEGDAPDIAGTPAAEEASSTTGADAQTAAADLPMSVSDTPGSELTPAPDAPATNPPRVAPPPPSFTLDDRPQTVYPALTGTAEPGAVVTIQSQDDSVSWTIVADSTGDWRTELSGLGPGTTTISAIQTIDRALTSASTTPTRLVISRPPTGILAPADADPAAPADAGQLYTITAEGIPGQTFRYTTPSNGFTSSELTFDADGHWTAPTPLQLTDTGVLFYYVSGPRTGPTQAADIAKPAVTKPVRPHLYY